MKKLDQIKNASTNKGAKTEIVTNTENLKGGIVYAAGYGCYVKKPGRW
jgi:hypothetical protein